MHPILCIPPTASSRSNQPVHSALALQMACMPVLGCPMVIRNAGALTLAALAVDFQGMFKHTCVTDPKGTPGPKQGPASSRAACQGLTNFWKASVRSHVLTLHAIFYIYQQPTLILVGRRTAPHEACVLAVHRLEGPCIANERSRSVRLRGPPG